MIIHELARMRTQIVDRITITLSISLWLIAACMEEKDGERQMGNDLSQIHITESWKVLNLQTGTTNAIVRINEGLSSIKGHPSLSNRIGIAMPLPPEFSMDDLNSIEDFLFDSSEASNNRFIIAVIITAPEFREFVLYLNDPSDAIKVIEDVKRKYPKWQFQYYVKSDPNWEGYSEFLR